MNFLRLLQAAARRGLIALVILVGGLLLPAVALAAPASGVYVGATDPSDAQAFGSWRGQPVGLVDEYTGDQSWSDVSNVSWITDGWQSFRQAGGTLVLCVPLLVSDQSGSFQSGAAGAYDQYFTAMGQQLVSAGYSNTILRLGAEFNGSWEPYALQPSGPNSPQNFIAYWQHLVTLLRAIPGENFKFDWNPNIDQGTVAPDQAYPGDAYVDYIGVDSYDEGWAADGGPISDPATRWQQITTSSYGLDYWASFAQSHGKPLTIPEWGLDTTDNNGGGDDPYYIQQMHNWMNAHNVAFEVYFNWGGYAVKSSSVPNAASEYQQLWSTQTSSSSSSSSSTGTTTTSGSSTPTSGSGATASAPTSGSGATASAPTSGSGTTASAPTSGSGATASAPTSGSGATASVPTSGSGATASVPTSGSGTGSTVAAPSPGAGNPGPVAVPTDPVTGTTSSGNTNTSSASGSTGTVQSSRPVSAVGAAPSLPANSTSTSKTSTKTRRASKSKSKMAHIARVPRRRPRRAARIVRG